MNNPPPVPGGDARLISCILPDDGTERRLLAWLRDEKGITRANSVYCRRHPVLQKTGVRRGKLPEPVLARLVTIVVEAEFAAELFDLVCEQADIGRPNGGALFMTSLSFATPFLMPEGLVCEPG